MHRNVEFNPGPRGPIPSIVDVMGKTFLPRIEIDRRDPLAGLKQRHGNVHRRGRLPRTAFFVSEDYDMRREGPAELRLHQHETQPLRCDHFSVLKRAASRYSIRRNKLIVNDAMHRENLRGCARAVTS